MAFTAGHSKAVVLSIIVAPIVLRFCSFGSCFVMQYLVSFSIFAIILVRMRELVALLYVLLSCGYKDFFVL